ncbi:MAG: acryloyl-CoA reductase [Chromatiales bacterium]|jgi:acrylyl-CoA reductase (NADPH)|nr:acryloyl-CoA reductase [Chromatiales bacterium]
MKSFRAFRVHADKSGVSAGVEELTLADLTPGEVVVKGEWSSINYKDALAATGAGRILRTSPLVGGVDIAGTVISSEDPDIAVGQRVLMNGGGLSEVRDGGFTEVASLPSGGPIPIPDELSSRDAMLIGTAGFTAAYAIHRMELNGQRPANGAIAVTGATGGVGSVAIDMLAGLGYSVMAMSTKPEQADYLKSLGASEVLDLKEFDFGKRPLEKGLWSGAIDNLGGETLAGLIRNASPNANIAAIGLAQGFEVNTTVMPFILRGVNLLGINSVDVPRELRVAIWQRIATDLRPRHLALMESTALTLDTLMPAFQPYVDGKIIGRTLVRLS